MTQVDTLAWTLSETEHLRGGWQGWDNAIISWSYISFCPSGRIQATAKKILYYVDFFCEWPSISLFPRYDYPSVFITAWPLGNSVQRLNIQRLPDTLLITRNSKSTFSTRGWLPLGSVNERSALSSSHTACGKDLERCNRCGHAPCSGRWEHR